MASGRKFESIVNSNNRILKDSVDGSLKKTTWRVVPCLTALVIGGILSQSGTASLVVMGLIIILISTISVLESLKKTAMQSALAAAETIAITKAVVPALSNISDAIEMMVAEEIMDEDEASKILDGFTSKYHSVFSGVKQGNGSINSAIKEFSESMESIDHALTELAVGRCILAFGEEYGDKGIVDRIYAANDDDELDDIIENLDIIIDSGYIELSNLAINGEEYLENASLEDIKSAIAAVDLAPTIIEYALDTGTTGNSKMEAM